MSEQNRPWPDALDKLDALDVAQLRAWRARVTHEETVVSYWRRLIQGRIDVLTAGSTQPAPTTTSQVAAALTHQEGAPRRKITTVGGTPGGMPDLPGLPAGALQELWDAVPDGPEVEGFVTQLKNAEQILGEHRSFLHALLDGSAKVLAARYEKEPDAVEYAWANRHSTVEDQ